MKLKNITFLVIAAFMLIFLSSQSEVFSFGCWNGCGLCLSCYGGPVKTGNCEVGPGEDERYCIEEETPLTCNSDFMFDCCNGAGEKKCKEFDPNGFPYPYIRCIGDDEK